MKILIDIQSVQGENGHHGIGRYSISLTKAILKNNVNHDIYILLNGAFIYSTDKIKKDLKDLIPKDHILTFFPITPANHSDDANIWNIKTSELIREYVISQLKPDVVHINSLFEGFIDDIVVSVKDFDRLILTSVTLYDLIPLIHREKYIDTGPPHVGNWYFKRIEQLKKADLLLAISESSKKEAIDYLGIDEAKINTVYNACDEKFKKIDISEDQRKKLLQKYNISKRFILHVPSGFDIRKNVDGLIKAYAKLPPALKDAYNLVIASKIDDGNKAILEKLIKDLRLDSRVVLTGYVPDDDLVVLYNLCDLFVYPSFHEGFGLPVLEAMSCGAPVIGSNTTSIPEVIGTKDALFDPSNIDSIAFKIKEVLTNDRFIKELKEYGLKRSKEFSWDNSAKKAIEAFEELYNKSQKKVISFEENKKLKLAYISPLPPEQSGISYYSKELLPYLSKHYDIELVVDQEYVYQDIAKDFAVRDIKYFKTNYDSYDRVLYHIGNSSFHKHMLFLLEDYPGVIVLHDFYISNLHWWMQHEAGFKDFFTKEIYYSHGYTALKFLKDFNVENTIFTYPLNLSVLQNAKGVIVHSPFSKELAKKFYGILNLEDWYIVKQIRELVPLEDKEIARKKLNIHKDDFVICSFGYVGKTKLNHVALESFAKSSLSKLSNVKLVFVGEGNYISNAIKDFNLEDKVIITGFVDKESYNNYLLACDIAIQLRTLSRGETSRAVLDCLSYGIPTVVNAHATMSDYPKDVVYMLEDEFKVEELSKAIEELYNNKELRKTLSLKAREYIKDFHCPDKIAEYYKYAIESIYTHPSTHDFLNSIDIDFKKDISEISINLAKNINPKPRLRQLFVDVSVISKQDLKTGIERVVKAQLKYLLEKPPTGYRIEPIYLENVNGTWVYKYARVFTSKFLGIDDIISLEDEPIDVFDGDLFYAPDLFHLVYDAANQGIYKYMRAKNAKIIFLVHDILPILRPDCFPEISYSLHSNWLRAIATYADKLICVSKAVEDELIAYLKENNLLREDLEITHLHNGSDISFAKHSSGLDKEDLEIFNIISKKPYFLMVSTIEPRKGHRQVLKAFEILWKNGYDFNLVFAGKQGWMVEELIDYIQNHQEKNKRLFWLGYISDDLLEMLYKNATATIVASEGEGFGLPIIEAAYYKSPLILRDIPVFREIAKDSAYYFSNTKDENILAKSIKEWYNLYKESKHPKPDGIKWMSWQENVERLLEVILEGE